MKLSATSIGCFKECPLKFYYRYILGLRPIVEGDALRIGTNYHRIQEISSMRPGNTCECAAENRTSVCELCEGSGLVPDDTMDAVVRHLNKAYAVLPLDKTPEEWEVERTILLYSLAGYKWWYNDSGYDVECLEQKFKFPLLSADTGNPVHCTVVGKIDRVFSIEGRRYIHEYKSTSASLEPDSLYWGSLRLDTQTRLYAYAAQRTGLGNCGLLYDVWHKPAIRPKKLTQSDSKKFVSDGVYFGEQFELTSCGHSDGVSPSIRVNGKEAEVSPGAKEGTFAIRETPQMFGARLLEEITTNPEKYFARKEVDRSESDIASLEKELYCIYKTISYMGNAGHWFPVESQCESYGKCDFIDACYALHTIEKGETPAGFTKFGA